HPDRCLGGRTPAARRRLALTPRRFAPTVRTSANGEQASPTHGGSGMDRYLHLWSRPAASPRRGRPRRAPAISVPSLLGLVGLLVSAGMAAAALGRLVAAIPDGVAQQPAAAGCLDAPVEALAASHVAGRAHT